MRLSTFDGVRLVAVWIDRCADVLVLAEQHRQFVPQWFLRAGQIHLLVRPENPRIVNLQTVGARQRPLARPAKRFERAAASSFLEALKARLPVVAEQTFLQRHPGQLLRFLNLYRAGTPATEKGQST